MPAGSRERGVERPVLRGGALRWAPVAAWLVGCAAPGPYRIDPDLYRHAAHAEPELADEPAAVPAVQRAAAPAPGRAPAAPTAPAHKVEPGQTLFRIARMYGTSVDELMRANGITDPRTLAVGQELVIPGAAPVAPPAAADAAHAAGPGTTGTDPPRAAPAPPPATGRREALVMPTRPGLLEWPLKGVLYARFGAKGKERHDGIDLAAPLGTPIAVARAGTVLYAGEQKGYGLIVIVDHGDDLITLYAHNRDVRVRGGQKVREGQVVATVGQSGRTSGPYLHFEVRRKGLPVDPLQYLGPPPDRRALGRRAR